MLLKKARRNMFSSATAHDKPHRKTYPVLPHYHKLSTSPHDHHHHCHSNAKIPDVTARPYVDRSKIKERKDRIHMQEMLVYKKTGSSQNSSAPDKLYAKTARCSSTPPPKDRLVSGALSDPGQSSLSGPSKSWRTASLRPAVLPPPHQDRPTRGESPPSCINNLFENAKSNTA